MKVGQVNSLVLESLENKSRICETQKQFSLLLYLSSSLKRSLFCKLEIEIGNVPQNLLEENCLQYLISPFLSQCMCAWPLNGPFFSELTQPERNFHFNALSSPFYPHCGYASGPRSTLDHHYRFCCRSVLKKDKSRKKIM